MTQERVVSLLEQGLTGDAQPPQERQQLMVVGARVALADMCGLAGQHERRKLVLQQAVEEVRRLHGRGVEDHSDFLRASLQLAACHATLGEWQEVRDDVGQHSCVSSKARSLVITLMYAMPCDARGVGRRGVATLEDDRPSSSHDQGPCMKAVHAMPHSESGRR